MVFPFLLFLFFSTCAALVAPTPRTVVMNTILTAPEDNSVPTWTMKFESFWDLNRLPTTIDTAHIGDEKCLVPGQYEMIVTDSVTVAALRILSAPGMGRPTCAATLVVRAGAELHVTGDLVVRRHSRLVLEGGTVSAANIFFEKGSFVVGSGVLSATGVIDFDQSAVIPGQIDLQAKLECAVCFRALFGYQTYGDFLLQAPTVKAFSALFTFANLPANSTATDFPNRSRPGTPHSTIQVDGTLELFGLCTVALFNSSQNDPSTWPRDFDAITFSSINTTGGAFIVEGSQTPAVLLPELKFVDCQPGLCRGNPLTVIDHNQPQAGCGLLTTTALSLVTSGSPSACERQSDGPVTSSSSGSETPSGSTSETPSGSTSERASWVLPVAIAVPVCVVVGVAVAVLIVVLQRRSTALYTKNANAKIAMTAMD